MAEKQIWQKIGESFIQEYYNQFDNTNRMDIANLYVSIVLLHWHLVMRDQIQFIYCYLYIP